ncbi:MAG: alpha/beta fold hydrolase [Candidatus Nanopelagicales bacterium]
MERDVRIVDIDGLRIRVAVRGVAECPLLLVMGIGGNLDMWPPFERPMRRRGVATIAYDAPGTGGSTSYPLPKRMRGLTTTVEHLLDSLGRDRVDVLGVSFGGGIAQQLAHQAPHRVRRLVLAATAPGLGGVPGHPRALLALATPRRYIDPEHFTRVAADVYGGKARRDPGGLAVGSPERFAKPPSLMGYLEQMYAVPGWSSLPWLHRIPHPTLVLAGDDDPIVPVINGRILAARIPHARLHVVKGGGHLFLLEEAEEIADVVADFLA